MKRRLFLTGPIGCGKSTAIRTALGDRISQCGGFLTRRYRVPHLHFTLESPDGKYQETFLSFATGKPVLSQSVFSVLGARLLHPRRNAMGLVPFILDEIGGIELLNPEFASGLESVLRSDVPILGVIKGEGPSGTLIEKLGLAEEYRLAAEKLRRHLRGDSETLVYECTQYDKTALELAERWAEEYLHDKLF